MAKYKASVKLYKGIRDFCSIWDDITKQCLSTDNEYSSYMKKHRTEVENRLSPKGDRSASWFGYPVPENTKDAMDRRTYQNIGVNPDGTLRLYDKALIELEPFFQFLEKISTGLIPKPTIVPNDRQLGSFSLARAMMSPTKTLCLWSNKHKREFTIAEGIPLDKNVKVRLNNEYEGKIDEEIECPLFQLTVDGSDAYLTQKLAKDLCLWSNKYKQEFGVTEGDPVLDERRNALYVKIKLSNTYEGKKDVEQECPLYKLKKDDSLAYLTDKVLDGKLAPIVLAWGSTNKKSFLYQEKLPKPNNNIRIFVLIGGDCMKTELYWAGIVAVMAAKFLSTKGYSIRVTGCIAIKSGSAYGGEKKFRFKDDLFDGTGYRLDLIDMKSYEEEIDSEGLLYPLADQSFFRIRCFDYFIARYWLYGDQLDTGLSYPLQSLEFENLVRDKIKDREIEQEKDVLYYFIGGNDVTSQHGAEMNLAKIIYCAEKRNRESLIKLGYAFEELETNVQKDFERLIAKYNLVNIKCNPDIEEEN